MKRQGSYAFDRTVAEEVMGRTFGDPEAVPPYSSEIAAAWEVVERLRAKGADVQIALCSYGHAWAVGFKPLAEGCELHAAGHVSDSAPFAICMAALKALRFLPVDTL